ncbi:MAG: SAM-dependent methyltransferase [Legionellaceae bacterium]|nr:SAM-dependent methyltransferase [Legionellaceae bacterium]
MSPLDHLREHLGKHGAIPFVDFMQQALYAPLWGYYTRPRSPLGAAGDFITAPELTPLFGYTLAQQCEQVLQHLNQPIIFEFGAGTGQLCIDILTRLEQLNALPHAYHILEVSASLQARQQDHIQTKIPHLAERVQWLSAWPEQAFEGVVIANEVLDAMPVHRFLKTDQGLLESMIALDEHNQLTENFVPCTNKHLEAHVERVLKHNTVPYASEANLFIDGWVEACHAMLKRGAVLLIDYGFPEHEYYHPSRTQGTLMCHYQHKAHPNPLLHPGEEDITAHVDFTHVADAALNAGFEVSGYTNQASFLLANGLLSLLEESVLDEPNQIKQQQAVKQLLQPHEMGELFKVIALTKQLDFGLTGFQLHDKRASL